MNLIKFNNNEIGFNYRKSLRLAKSFYRKNRLLDAVTILTKLRHHGFDEPEITLLAAQIYDKLTALTSEVEYEELALDLYEEIIRYTDDKKYVKKATQLRDNFIKKLSSTDDSDNRARIKAEELRNSKQMSPKAWFMLGANFSARKDPLFVITAYNNAIQLNEKYISALYRLGYIYQYNLNDRVSALSLYLKAIKIEPYEDTIESESTNVKTILEACIEISEIYTFDEQYGKVISVFDHAFRIYTAYSDICDIIFLKRIVANVYSASQKLNNTAALSRHVKSVFGYDFKEILNELHIG